MPTDLPEKPKPNPVAVAIGKGVLKLAEYMVLGFVHAGLCAGMALAAMLALGFMHDSEPAVPAFGFTFLFGAIWGSVVLATFVASALKTALKDDE